MHHKIEETVKVYLLWDDQAGAWVIDPLTCDGAQLDGLERGAYINCADLDVADDHGGCEAEADRANIAPLPNADELLRLLAGQLGYSVQDTRKEAR